MKILLFIIVVLASVKAIDWEHCCESLGSRPGQDYTFYQDTGRFIGGSGDAYVDTFGYSGKDDGRNNPED
jgi:hypothetical protein